MSYNDGMDMPFGASVTSPALEQAKLLLRQSERTFSQTQHELSKVMSVRSQTPMSQAESINTDREIQGLQARLQAQEKEVRDLKELVERQRVTIAQQSKAIEQPKQTFSTPSRREGSLQPGSFHGPKPNYPPVPGPLIGPGSGPAQQSSNQTPAGLAYQPPTGPRNVSHHGQSQQQWSTPGYQTNTILQPPPSQPHFHQRTTVTALGSPEPRPQSAATGFQPISKHSSHSSLSNPSSDPRRPIGMHINKHTPSPQQSRAHPPPAPFPHPPNPHMQNPPMQSPYMQNTHMQSPQSSSMAMVPVPPGAGIEHFKSAFEKVVNMSQQYAFSHVNIPSTAKDNQMPQAIKDRLLKAASMTTAFQFMSSPYTRFFLVTKIIIQWLIKNVLKHDSFRGLDPEVDNAIDGLRSSIYQSTPAQVKFQILNNIGQQMMRLRQRPDFAEHCGTLAHQRGNDIWAIIRPMMHQKTSRDWDDLLLLMIEAHNAAALMFSGSEEYRFEMPLAGTPFDLRTMVCKDTFQNIKPHGQLVAERAQVRLSISPLVVVRKTSPGGLFSSATVVPASVLLKVGN
ncbi:uncharacterized protein A1O9_10657 [Exophiala aquamarina CBS 119918]|uniref:Uncharacterized protein n=1 Tax=Exophiala aquamarina CBS 119918 TaxID=1182545 RepID=A0A072NZA1_9EURO|nr:uncharacterized protein A1O9_10657 [Exophiala aquamarina CBS 119918]KEF53209.1 hypothetical protein A1O9_10657 [Exophiala aquamarina CBS 119918]